MPWVFLGLSAGVAAGGVLVLTNAVDDADTVENAPDGTTWADIESAHDDAVTESWIGGALLGVGVLGAGLSLTWALSDSDEEQRRPVALLTPQGFVVRGWF